MSYKGQGTNDYGTTVSVFECEACGAEFTVCPEVPAERRENWRGCLAAECNSYDPARDVDRMFDDPIAIIGREPIC